MYLPLTERNASMVELIVGDMVGSYSNLGKVADFIGDRL
tara:strand:- start:300 stop:416 length:117 start_codon:yes stop_codon:yes gene_type:complete